MRIPASQTRAPRRGVVLYAVLVVIVVLTLAAYQYSEWMMAESRASDSSMRSAQTQALADSGVHYAAALLSSPDGWSELGGNPYDNPAFFRDIAVPGAVGRGGRPGRFSVLALRAPDDPLAASGPYGYGVVDESGKINLNALLQLDNGQGNLGQQLLLGLPNMTEDVANAILDWLDSDDTPRTNGAESDYYSGLSPPYQCKNGPLDSLEELLLVKGVTPQLLFGNDRNRNGMVDPDEDDGSGQANIGWSAYLTVYSREANVDSQGNPRLWLNDPDLGFVNDNLTQIFGQNVAAFVVGYRLYGSSGGGGGGGGGGGNDPDSSRSGGGNPGNASAAVSQIQSAITSGTQGRTRIRSLWDLVASGSLSVPTSSGNGQSNVSFPNPFSDPAQAPDLLPLLFDKTTTTSNPDLPPRININTATPTVLNALSQLQNGFSDTDLQNILSNRPSPSSVTPTDPTYQTPAWLYLQANVSPQTLRQVDSYITARSQVYRVQSVGYFEGGGPSVRVEAVFDTNHGRPRIVYWRNLTELGKGFDLGMGH